MKGRIRSLEALKKLMSIEEASKFIKSNMTIALKDFSPFGYSSSVFSMSKEKNLKLYRNRNLNLYDCNEKIDLVIIEAIAITEKFEIILSDQVGFAMKNVRNAKSIIIEINLNYPMEFEDIIDIPPNKIFNQYEKLCILKGNELVGNSFLEIDEKKVVAIVESDYLVALPKFFSPRDISKKIANNIHLFLKTEVLNRRLPVNLLPFQVDTGSMMNEILKCFSKFNFKKFSFYTDVVQDGIIDLIELNKVEFVSCSIIMLSEEKIKNFHKNIKKFVGKLIIRPYEVILNKAILKRIGIISINFIDKVDVHGNICLKNKYKNTKRFIDNSYINIFIATSLSNNGGASTIVPIVFNGSDINKNYILITENGIADLRNIPPNQISEKIINNCSNLFYKDLLWNYISDLKNREYIS